MQIHVSTDHNITGNEALAAEVTEVVRDAVTHFSDRITTIEVHISDENGPKSGANDIRCMLEARIEHRQPIAVTHHGDTVALAVHGAAHELVSLIEHRLGRTEAGRHAVRD